MKMTIKIIFVALLMCAYLDLRALVVSDSSKSEINSEKSRKKKFMGVIQLRKTVDLLEIQPGFHPLHHSYLLGDVRLEDSGIHFIPRTQSPDGLPEVIFQRHWWYNPLFKELYIPYTDIKKVRTYVNLVIKTKDGRKYRISSRNYKEQEAKIKARLK